MSKVKANGSETEGKVETTTMKVFGVSDLQKSQIHSAKIDLNGETGLIYFKSVSGRLIKELSEGAHAGLNGVHKLAKRLSESLVNEDGSPLMTEDQLMDVPLENLNLIFTAISDELSKDRTTSPGEDSSGVPSSAQSTN